ncbi:unnamed protein product [Trypanosoma congolense IL3000]|uniref:WGS project CAEQ00000000 data, annotated contig 1246 n=1 Tax=Trypanosoma congolense (strain IL3000) TaxID=1068625 RepID=F9W4X1_TRYCI|nr:unnamed protein product [Trypanosoma congolense IL3000]
MNWSFPPAFFLFYFFKEERENKGPPLPKTKLENYHLDIQSPSKHCCSFTGKLFSTPPHCTFQALTQDHRRTTLTLFIHNALLVPGPQDAYRDRHPSLTAKQAKHAKRFPDQLEKGSGNDQGDLLRCLSSCCTVLVKYGHEQTIVEEVAKVGDNSPGGFPGC